MKSQLHLAILPLFGALAATVQASALVVDGGDPDQASAFLADANHDLSIAATRFSLTDAVAVNQLEWWGIYYPTGAATVGDDFTLAIYLDASGLPGNTLASIHLGQVQREATGQTVILFPEYVYTAFFPTITLAAGDYIPGARQRSRRYRPMGLGNHRRGTASRRRVLPSCVRHLAGRCRRKPGLPPLSPRARQPGPARHWCRRPHPQPPPHTMRRE
nr:hypothetical protein [uncultured Lamprocystis sp.]